jgi:proteasome lid subunit RPN8/RPN11
MSRKSKPGAAQPRITIDGEVVRQIRQHARSNSKTEVCGVLIGNESGGALSIAACIAGLNAAQAGTHVTFTQDTWEHIYKTKDAKYPDNRIVGWYHSHPGFGVFLSDHDTFIHENFFSSPLQIAWVYDPLSDEEGCFGWVGKRLERLSEVSVVDRKGGEGAGETGKPEPMGMDDDESREENSANAHEKNDNPAWFHIAFSLLTHTIVLLIGFLAAWYLFPRILVWPIDAATGKPIIDRPVDLQTLEQMISDAKAQLKDKAAPPASTAQPVSPAPPAPSKDQPSKENNGAR